MKLKLKPLIISASIILLTGCVSAFQAIDEIKSKIGEDVSGSDRAINSFGQSPALSVLMQDNGVWVSGKSIQVADTLNPILALPIEIIMGNAGIDEIAEEITRRVQIPVNLAPEIVLAIKGQSSGASTGQMPPPNLFSMPGSPSVTPPAAQSNSSSAISKANYYTSLNHKGDLKGLLEILSAKMNINWNIENGELKLFRYTTDTFVIAAPHGESDFESKISTGGNKKTSSSGAAGGMGVQNVEADTELTSGVNAHQSPWDTVAAAAASMLSPEGKSALNEASGTITITDVKMNVDKVKNYITEQNNHYLAQAALSITVYLVQKNDDLNYALNYDALYQKVTGTTLSAVSPVGAAVAGAGSLSALILNAGSYSTNSEQAILEALRVQGDVTTLTTGSLTALNHRPSTVRVGTSEGYLKESGSTLAANVGATTNLKAGSVETGSYISVIPNIMDAERMTIQILINLSENEGIKEYKSGGSSIFAPKKNIREVVNPVYLKSGQTLVLGGIKAESSSSTENSLGDSWLLGGALKSKSTNATMVVVIKPVIL